MKKFMAVLAILIPLAGCTVAINVGQSHDAVPARTEYPTVNPPLSLRQQNWLGKKRYWDAKEKKWEREGSCVHATMISLFRWQGRPDLADYWRRTYDSGETPDAEVGDPDCNLADKLDKEGVRYAYTTNGDIEFLEWACSTRRGCGVTIMGGKHMVMLAYLDDEYAAILDPNDTRQYILLPRETFVAEWQNSDGWAVTPIYTPAPPQTPLEKNT